MSLNECLHKWRACDDARDGIPGEHAVVAAAGGALIVSALFARSHLSATLQALAGGALLVRAASGRDGIARWTSPPAKAEPAQDTNPWPFPKSPEPTPEAGG